MDETVERENESNLAGSIVRAQITVHAGLVAGETQHKATRVWNITDAMVLATEDIIETDHRYTDALSEALGYVAKLQNPITYNWVRLEWNWLEKNE